MTKIFKCAFAVLFLLAPFISNAADEVGAAEDSRYQGKWEGNWLEGMSSGKVSLAIVAVNSEIAFTARPTFGTEPTVISKIKGTDKTLTFYVTGADGHAMRFELKPAKDYKILRGKAYYDNLHMELELSRTP